MARTRSRRETRVWDEALPRVTSLLPAFLQGQRWFGGKGRRVRRVRLTDWASLRGAEDALLAIAEVTYADGGVERYFVPFSIAYGDTVSGAPIIARSGAITIGDAFWNDDFCRALLDVIARGAQVPTERGGQLAFEAIGSERPRPQRAVEDVRLVGTEQSNTSVIYGGSLILKAFRRLQEGVNPEVEILRFLTRNTGFDRVPALRGWADYREPDGSTSSLAVLQVFVPNEGDGWSWTLRALTGLLDRNDGDDSALAERGRSYFAGLAELGRVTAGLHLALATRTDDSSFAPWSISRSDVRTWQSSIVDRLDRALARLRERQATLPAPARTLAGSALAAEARLRSTIGGLADLTDGRTVKTRYHGDYHLGQVLKTADSFVILDFEGEPLRPLAERRALHTPLKDVAGLLRSLNYARFAALRAAVPSPQSQVPGEADLGPGTWDSGLAAAWEELARSNFLDAYVDVARAADAAFLPRSDETLRRVLAALELEKAAYELEYELDNRPDWLAIPLAALAEAPI